MTRARDLADIISGGFTEADIPALSASKITSGSFADGRIPNLAASKITSGAFDSARLTNAPSGGGHSRASVASSGNVTLDLSGDDNYFDAGTLTGSTTVTFGTPSDANKRFIYSFIPSYDSSASSVDDTDTWSIDASQSNNFADTSGESRAWSPDGKKYYINNSVGDWVSQYNLTSPFDLSTATFHYKVHLNNQSSSAYGPAIKRTLNATVTTAEDIILKPDGTKMFMVCRGTDDVKEFSMSTAFDISTLTYSSSDLYVGGQETNPFLMQFANNGAILYVSGTTGDGVDRWNLSTAYDVSTGTYAGFVSTNNLFNTTSMTTVLGFCEFSADGNTAFLAGSDSVTTAVYTLSLVSPFQLSTSATVSSTKVFNMAFDGNTGPGFPNWKAISMDRMFWSDRYMILERGTRYLPTFSTSFAGEHKYLDRGYRHFLEFETHDTGSSYQLINHTKVNIQT